MEQIMEAMKETKLKIKAGNKMITAFKKELKAETNPMIKKTITAQIATIEMENKGFEIAIKDFNTGSIPGDQQMDHGLNNLLLSYKPKVFPSKKIKILK